MNLQMKTLQQVLCAYAACAMLIYSNAIAEVESAQPINAWCPNPSINVSASQALGFDTRKFFFTDYEAAQYASSLLNTINDLYLSGYWWHRHWSVGSCNGQGACNVTTVTGDGGSTTYTDYIFLVQRCFTCPATYTHDKYWGMGCIRTARYNVSLSGPNSTEPQQGQTYTATVQHVDGTPITEPVTLEVSLKIEDKSGGHDHGDHTRPRGSIAGTECKTDDTCQTLTTDSNGIVNFDFTPPEASGKHTVTVACDKCSNGDSKEVEVKVEGLEPIAGSTYYALVEDGSTKVIGSTDKHSDNHYLKPEAASVLWRIALAYQFEQQFKLQDPVTGQFNVIPPPLHVNDASLKWGGLFDISGKWASPHTEHRRGTVIDVRANALPTAIPEGSFKKFKRLATRYGISALLEAPSIENRHFHLRLLNRKE